MTVQIKSIPKDIDELRGLATARQWEKAAHAWAFIGNGHYSFAEFVALGITGFRGTQTVRAYHAKWQEAINSGHAIKVKPGDQFALPDLPWVMESDASRSNRVDDPDAYALAAEEEGTTVGMAIRTGSSLPALKAAIKADPKAAEAARQALIEAFDEQRQEMIEAAKAKEQDTITCDGPKPTPPPVPKPTTPLAFIRMLKIDRDLRQLHDIIASYTFDDDMVRDQTVKLLDQFTATIAASKSLILDGSVSDQADAFLKSISHN